MPKCLYVILNGQLSVPVLVPQCIYLYVPRYVYLSRYPSLRMHFCEKQRVCVCVSMDVNVCKFLCVYDFSCKIDIWRKQSIRPI